MNSRRNSRIWKYGRRCSARIASTCLSRLQAEHVEQLRLESTRNQQLEKRLAEMANENAQRVAGTETHIAELSEQIGLIEKQR